MLRISFLALVSILTPPSTLVLPFFHVNHATNSGGYYLTSRLGESYVWGRIWDTGICLPGISFQKHHFESAHCCRHALSHFLLHCSFFCVSCVGCSWWRSNLRLYFWVFMNFHLGHIVGMGVAIEHLVDVGEVRVGQGVVIAEKIWFKKQEERWNNSKHQIGGHWSAARAQY